MSGVGLRIHQSRALTMAFLIYLFVLLVSAATVMVGFDLMTSPLPSTPNVPIGRTVRHVEAEPAIRAADKTEPAPRNADTVEKHLADRALTPIYPASPRPSAPMETSGPRHVETTLAPGAKQAAETQPTATPAPEQQAADVPLPPRAPRQQARTPLAAKHQRVVLQNGGEDELAEVVRVVKRQRLTPAKPIAIQRTANPRELSEVERIVRKMTRGRHEGDIPVIDGTGRVIVVHTGGARAQADREW
jgi:hypothetical protein